MTGHPDNAPTDLLQEIASAGLLPPKVLTVSVTSVCNLQCAHCWVECPLLTAEASAVNSSLLQMLLRKFIRLGVSEVCITGGEPLTHPDWRQILAFCCQQSELDKVVLQTNATLIDAPIAAELCTDEFRKLAVQVSLDGCTAATHDRVRGDGSLKQALHGLQCLVDAGLGPRTTIAFTEMRHNFAEIPQLLEIADHLGITRVVGLPLIDAGCAEQDDLIRLPTAEQYLWLLEQFDHDAVFKARYERIGCFSAIEWRKGMGGTGHGGCRFLEQPYVTVDGQLFPCVLLQAEEFSGRGCYERSLDEVIRAVLPAWRDLMLLSRTRIAELDCIRTCPGGKHCGGGCLARAYLASGSMTGPEDRCGLRRSVYAQSPKGGTRDR